MTFSKKLNTKEISQTVEEKEKKASLMFTIKQLKSENNICITPNGNTAL